MDKAVMIVKEYNKWAKQYREVDFHDVSRVSLIVFMCKAISEQVAKEKEEVQDYFYRHAQCI